MIIIVSGLPGSGKSYFATRLAKDLDAHYLSSDLTRKDMDARGMYAFNDKLEVYEEMARRAGDILRRGESVVVDATFYKSEMRNMFLALARLLHSKAVYLEIVAEEELVRERLSRPRLDSEADFSVYKLVRSQYEPYKEDHLVIESTSDNIGRMLKQGIDYIRRIDEVG